MLVQLTVGSYGHALGVAVSCRTAAVADRQPRCGHRIQLRSPPSLASQAINDRAPRSAPGAPMGPSRRPSGPAQITLLRAALTRFQHTETDAGGYGSSSGRQVRYRRAAAHPVRHARPGTGADPDPCCTWVGCCRSWPCTSTTRPAAPASTHHPITCGRDSCSFHPTRPRCTPRLSPPVPSGSPRLRLSLPRGPLGRPVRATSPRTSRPRTICRPGRQFPSGLSLARGNQGGLNRLVGPIGLVHGFVHETRRDRLRWGRRSGTDTNTRGSSAQATEHTGDYMKPQRRAS